MNQNVRVQRQKFQNELNVTLKNGKKGFVSVLWKCFGLKTTSFNECSAVVNIV